MRRVLVLGLVGSFFSLNSIAGGLYDKIRYIECGINGESGEPPSLTVQIWDGAIRIKEKVDGGKKGDFKWGQLSTVQVYHHQVEHEKTYNFQVSKKSPVLFEKKKGGNAVWSYDFKNGGSLRLRGRLDTQEKQEKVQAVLMEDKKSEPQKMDGCFFLIGGI